MLNDDLIDMSLMENAVGDEIERLHEMRSIAQKAFVEHNAKETVGEVMQARSRPPQDFDFEAGEYVFVYRVPRQRKRRVGGPDAIDRHANKPYTGLEPLDGAYLWISMFGELWRAARERNAEGLRATSVERQGIEIIMNTCKELVKEYKKTSRRTGFKDIKDEPWPGEGQCPEEQKEDPEEAVR